MKRAWFLPLTLLLLIGLTGCVNEELTGTNTTGPVATPVYFPVSVGNSWVYQSYEMVDGGWEELQVTHRRILEGQMYEGEYGYISVDSIGVGSGTTSQRFVMRRNQGTYHRVTSIHNQEVTDNDWGAWQDLYNFDSGAEGARWMESDTEDGIAYWELTSLSEAVEVEAGSFGSCRVNMWRTEGGGLITERRHYFVSGVGEVLEEVRIWQNGSLMLHQRRELVSYQLN